MHSMSVLLLASPKSAEAIDCKNDEGSNPELDVKPMKKCLTVQSYQHLWPQYPLVQKRTKFQFSFIYIASNHNNVISRDLKDTAQSKPIRIQFILIQS